MANNAARIFGKLVMLSVLVFAAVFAWPGMSEAKEREVMPEESWAFAEDFVREIERLGYDTGCVVFFEPDEYDNLAIEERVNQNALYVEVTYGEKQNAEGDGVILNTSEDFYNYIAYSEFVPEGIPIVSFELYNPDNGFFDDIIERYDYWEFAGDSHLLRHW